MPLSQFAREGCPVHLEVPGLSETLWFVPGEIEAAQKVAEGVRRGRVWTALELQDLMRQPGLTSDDAITVARVRLSFDATVVPTQVEEEAESAPNSLTCRACGGSRFWRSVHGSHLTCGTCHPPAVESLVAEWIESETKERDGGYEPRWLTSSARWRSS